MKNTVCEARIKMTRYLLIVFLAVLEAGCIWLLYKQTEGKDQQYIIPVLSCMFLLPGVFITVRNMIVSRLCHLKLTDNRVSGVRRKLISREELDLPIDKIDSIRVCRRFMDILEGGKTLQVRSVSGVVEFPWVQNAEEFREAVMKAIDEYKDSMSMQTSVHRSSAGRSGSNNTANKMQELTDLFDQGLISRSEFDAKRKELLNKM